MRWQRLQSGALRLTTGSDLGPVTRETAPSSPRPAVGLVFSCPPDRPENPLGSAVRRDLPSASPARRATHLDAGPSLQSRDVGDSCLSPDYRLGFALGLHLRAGTGLLSPRKLVGHWLKQAGVLLEGGEPLLAFPDPRVSLTATVFLVAFALFGFV